MAIAPLQERGFIETLRSIRGCIHARRKDRADGFDRRFGTDTDRRISLEDLDATGPDVLPLWRYWPTLEAPFRRMMEAANIRHEEFVFVDLGSGKGRALFYASDLPFSRIVGVEISPALHRVAEQNISIYGSITQRCFRFELLNMDAAAYPLPRENTLLYLFQPFPAHTMEAVLRNVIESVRSHAHQVAIAYINPLFDRLILETGIFERHASGPSQQGEFAWSLYLNRI